MQRVNLTMEYRSIFCLFRLIGMFWATNVSVYSKFVRGTVRGSYSGHCSKRTRYEDQSISLHLF